MARVLVIDDDEGMRHVLRLALARMGHTVTEAANGVEGLRAFRAGPVDLVLTDLVMPEKEGIETIMELRRLAPTTKIIAMSGGTDPDLVRTNLQSARLLGAAMILTKPFDLADLAAAVNRLLGPESDPGS